MHKDATLASVLLLALFKCINPTTRDQRAWRNHIISASKLAEDRGCQLREIKTGRALLMAVRTQMVSFHGMFNPVPYFGYKYPPRDRLSI